MRRPGRLGELELGGRTVSLGQLRGGNGAHRGQRGQRGQKRLGRNKQNRQQFACRCAK